VQKIEGRFGLKNAKPIEGKHELLLDDGITTGAPLEACYEEF